MIWKAIKILLIIALVIIAIIIVGIGLAKLNNETF